MKSVSSGDRYEWSEDVVEGIPPSRSVGRSLREDVASPRSVGGYVSPRSVGRDFSSGSVREVVSPRSVREVVSPRRSVREVVSPRRSLREATVGRSMKNENWRNDDDDLYIPSPKTSVKQRISSWKKDKEESSSSSDEEVSRKTITEELPFWWRQKISERSYTPVSPRVPIRRSVDEGRIGSKEVVGIRSPSRSKAGMTSRSSVPMGDTRSSFRSSVPIGSTKSLREESVRSPREDAEKMRSSVPTRSMRSFREESVRSPREDAEKMRSSVPIGSMRSFREESVRSPREDAEKMRSFKGDVEQMRSSVPTRSKVGSVNVSKSAMSPSKTRITSPRRSAVYDPKSLLM